MFARIKKSGKHQYLQIVENRKVKGKVVQRVIATIGRRIMELRFTDKQVVTACGSPTNFYVNEAGAYASNKILPGATASLCFIQKGEYAYKLTFRSLRGFGPGGSILKQFEGKVVVK